jgi:hypothetical protein
MIWTRPDLGQLRVTLERIGGPNDPYTRVVDVVPLSGPANGATTH